MNAIMVDDAWLAQEYEAIKARFLGQGHILAIKDCESAMFALPDEEKLQACGIPGCRLLIYFADAFDRNTLGDDRIAGRHIPVETADGRRSVIVMRRDYPAEFSPAFVWAYKVCALYHELGHAEDFHEGINFQHATLQCDEEAAEKYANAFARKYLKRIKCREIRDGKESGTTLWDWYSEVKYVGDYVNE